MSIRYSNQRVLIRYMDRGIRLNCFRIRATVQNKNRKNEFCMRSPDLKVFAPTDFLTVSESLGGDPMLSSLLRSRTLSSAVSQWMLPPALGLTFLNRALCSSSKIEEPHNEANTIATKDKHSSTELLNLEEVKKILNDVHADDVKVIPVPKHYDFADYMVVATGRSEWHVRNIAQALLYRVKQKQKGAKRMLLPNVEGQEVGKWIVIDSGNLIIHALDEKVRAYYNLEQQWSSETSNTEHTQDLEKAFVKIRRKNNSKKRPQVNT